MQILPHKDTLNLKYLFMFHRHHKSLINFIINVSKKYVLVGKHIFKGQIRNTSFTLPCLCTAIVPNTSFCSFPPTS